MFFTPDSLCTTVKSQAADYRMKRKKHNTTEEEEKNIPSELSVSVLLRCIMHGFRVRIENIDSVVRTFV